MHFPDIDMWNIYFGISQRNAKMTSWANKVSFITLLSLCMQVAIVAAGR